MEIITPHTVPNHHAGQGSFSGLGGLAVGLTMAFGRTSDARWVVELTGATPGDRVVDIGCGPGATVRYATRSGLTAIGVDPAPQMLRLARRLGGRARAATYVIGTAESLPLDDRSVNVAWSLASVHHWSDVEAGVREMRRVLAPGGRLAAVERRTVDGATGLASHGWTDGQAERFGHICTAHGFTDVRVEHTHVRRRRRLIAVVATAPR